MSENKNYSFSTDFGWIALAALVIFFHGEPDLQDAIMQKLCNGSCAVQEDRSE